MVSQRIGPFALRAGQCSLLGSEQSLYEVNGWEGIAQVLTLKSASHIFQFLLIRCFMPPPPKRMFPEKPRIPWNMLSSGIMLWEKRDGSLEEPWGPWPRPPIGCGGSFHCPPMCPEYEDAMGLLFRPSLAQFWPRWPKLSRALFWYWSLWFP